MVAGDTARFWYTSAYVKDDRERGDLITAADSALRCLAGHATVIAGHQLCSDLAVLAAAVGERSPAIHEQWSAGPAGKRCLAMRPPRKVQ